MVQKAHAAGTKVILSFAGGAGVTYDPDLMMDTIASDSSAEKNFITHMMNLVRSYDLDGIDNDWEPYTSAWSDASIGLKYESLMKAIRDSLTAQETVEKATWDTITGSKEPFVGKTLSAAAIAEPSYSDRYITANTLILLDYVTPMMYFFGPSASDSINLNVAYWTNTRSLPKSKLIIALPFYGVSPLDWSPSQATQSYRALLANDSLAYTKDTTFYISNTYYYAGPHEIAKRVDTAWSKCGGTACWDLVCDAIGDKSLLNALQRERILLDKPMAISNNPQMRQIPNLTLSGTSLVLSEPAMALRIYSPAGKIIAYHNLGGHSSRVPIEGKLAKGLYIAEIMGMDGAKYVQRIVIR